MAKRGVNLTRSAFGGSSLMRAAANSIANGNPSRCRQISATARAFALQRYSRDNDSALLPISDLPRPRRSRVGTLVLVDERGAERDPIGGRQPETIRRSHERGIGRVLREQKESLHLAPRERLRPSRVATRERDVTQPQALALLERHPDAAGLRWWSTFESLWANVTLFDRAASKLQLISVRALDLAADEIVAAAEFLGLRVA